MKVAFIGLGIMGEPMARHLEEEGHLFNVYNRTFSKTEAFAERGIGAAQTPKEAAEGADVIITMVSDSPDVEEVVLGTDGIIHTARAGSVLIDMSSINPEVSKRIGARLAENGVDMLDAPVSGGDRGAQQGTLAIMVGGKEESFESVRPVLETMGSSVVRVGPLGSGGYAKLANNIIVALNLQAMSEAYALAEKAGLDVEKLYHAISGGLAGSNVMDLKIEKLVQKQFEPGFKVTLHHKDLKNALQAAESQKVSLPFTDRITDVMQRMKESGMGEKDHSALYEYLLHETFDRS